MKWPILFGDGQLLIGHIHAGNLACGPDKLRQGIDIPPRTTARIRNPATFQRNGGQARPQP